MNTYEFLRYLRSLDIKLSTDDRSKLKCDAPKGILTPSLQAEISKRKVDILQLLKSTTVSGKEGSLIETVRRDRDLPLSFAQQRLWFLQQLEPESSIYHITQTLRLHGQLQVDTLRQAFATILERHESLRTTFVATDGVATQVITGHVKFDLPLIDLSSQDPEQQELMMQSALQQATHRPFDLTADLMLRAMLIRLREEEHVLQIIMHHIASDGWSMGVFTRELSTLYQAFLSGHTHPLPDLPIQYADFAAWQRQWLAGEVLNTQLSYWKQHLSGAPLLLELPTDHPRPPQLSYRGGTLTFQVTKPLADALKRLSQQTGSTLFMTLLTAFNILLYRYTQQEDIVVGSPIANRNRVELEELIGFFANTLALRNDLSGNPSFRNLLERVRQVALNAYAHQDVPFEKLVEELQPERNLSHSPLFQVMFVLQSAPRSAQQLAELSIQPERVENETAKFDLTLSMTESTDGLSGTLEYSTDLFEVTTIERMVGHFQTLLEGIVTNPDQPIATLPILTAAEQHQLLVEWNVTQTEYPKDKCIHQLFEDQVELTPHAVAVVFADRQLTYQELNQRANQLAHYLQSLGVKPDVLVGISVERSLETIVALLAILKAGGAYVPIDPSYPTERLAITLDDAQISVLLTQKLFVDRLPSSEVQVVCLDTDWEKIKCQKDDNPICNAIADNLAYVTYTSGSTGKPRGVCATHRGVVRLVKNNNYANLNRRETFLQLAPISFDASTFEIWGSLLNGARLVVFPPHTPSLEELGQIIQYHHVTILWLTAGLFHLMVEERIDDLKPLRQLLAGGDVLSIPHVQKFRQKVGDCQLINGYGPTENTTFTCCYHVTETELLGNSVPIGRPIANTQIYILDQSLQPVPIGVSGELYVGGDGLARGYLNKPELTAEKFIPNPFSDRPGVLLYKTGDLARYLSDGNIEFLGRIDNQVKIRGFRIELGEVEAALSQHAAIQQTVLIPREDNSGTKYLVAYLVLSQDQVITVDEIRRFLLQKLPNYMVPSAFVFLDVLPLTPNGKVDRHALPAPDSTRLDSENNYVSPRNALELQLTKIWEQVLDRQPIGVRDNFFELGGHSLLAVRLFAQVEKALQTSLPLSAIFQAPTIAELARALRSEVKLPPWYSLVPIQPQGSRPILFGIHYFRFSDLSPYLGKEQPIYGLRYGIAEPMDRKLSLPPLTELVAHYIEEMCSLQPTGPYFLMGLSDGGIIAYEMAQQLVAQGREVALLVLFDTYLAGKNSPKQLLPLHQRLSNLWNLGLTKFLTLAIYKLSLKLQRLQEQLFLQSLSTDPKYQYLPHSITVKSLSLMLRDYSLQSYSGRVLCFVARDTNYTYSSPVIYQTDPPDTIVRKLVKGELEVHTIPGSHTDILDKPHVQLLAETLKSCIDRILAD